MNYILFTQLFLFAIFVLCRGRVVKVPAGPLVRVEGQAVSIRCDVSDYEGPLDQDFEWTVVRGAKSLKLISTFDISFTDPMFKDRVNSGDISIVKRSDSSVDLKIKKVASGDSAVYRCSTPSTDSTFMGNYDADVELKVIPDNLKVVPIVPKSSVAEGDQLELVCNTTKSVTEHTYLSITWAVRKDPSPLEEILTYGPGDGVTVGTSFTQRYTDSGLRLDLRGGGVYALLLTGARPADQGTYVCKVKEWVKQPGGGAWTSILEKSAEMGAVKVTPTAKYLGVTAGANTTLNVDDTLSLTCSITADNLVSLGLEVTWLINSDTTGGPRTSTVLVHMDRNGIVTNGSNLLGISRVGAGDFQLVLQKAEKADSGLYSCRVRAWLPQNRGWYQAAVKTSDPVQVLVKQLEPEFKVTLNNLVTPHFSGDPTELACHVTNMLRLGSAQLGVSWLFTATTPADKPAVTRTVATLNALVELSPGEQYKQRLQAGYVVLWRVEPDTFVLRFLQTRDEDMGDYTCIVTAWKPERQKGWAKVKEVTSAPFSVRWVPKIPVLSVAAHRIREASTGGSTFEMSCRVTSQNLPNPGYSVLIRVEDPTPGGATRKVLSLSADSVLELEDWSEPGRTDSVVLEKTGAEEYRFRLYGAQVSDRGLYYCDVTAWTRDQGSSDWTRVVSAESNKIQIAFEDTGPVFNVSARSNKARVQPGDTAKIDCIVTTQGVTPNSGDVSYEVRWYREADLLASVDRWGVVRKVVGSNSTECSLERTDASTFTLHVHSTQNGQEGGYHCTATPWLLSPTTGAWTRGLELKSTPVNISVKLAFWESLKMPLLYGVASALAVGLLSLLLGLVCAHCCCQNALQNRRSSSKLMDLEIDWNQTRD